MTEEFVKHLKYSAVEIENFFSEYFSKNELMADEFRYSVLCGGKRFRPALVMIFKENMTEVQKSDAMKAAGAIELIHSFSLVHDDLPEMDNDLERRGKPSCHAKFGHAQALLCGDGLSTLAFRLIADVSSGELTQKLSKLLAESSLDMIKGQFLELKTEDISTEKLIAIHRLKTGALIKCALMMGAFISYDGFSQEILSEYADNLGLLFQITDDLLDEGDDRKNLASFLGRQECISLARSTADRALSNAERFGKETKLLSQAVNYLIDRI